MLKEFKRIYEKYNFPTGNLAFLYDFASYTSSGIPDVSYYATQSGAVSNGMAFLNSGVFPLNGNTQIQVNKYNNYFSKNQQNFSFIGTFERTTSGNHVIFHENWDDNIIYTVGINDNNKFFLHHLAGGPTPTGETHVFDAPIGKKASFVFEKSPGKATLYILDLESLSYKDQSVSLYPDYFFTTNTKPNFYIGNAPSSYKTAYGLVGFSGYIEQCAGISSIVGGSAGLIGEGLRDLLSPTTYKLETLVSSTGDIYTNKTGQSTGIALSSLNSALSSLNISLRDDLVKNYIEHSGALSGNYSGGSFYWQYSARGLLSGQPTGSIYSYSGTGSCAGNIGSFNGTYRLYNSSLSDIRFNYFINISDNIIQPNEFFTFRQVAEQWTMVVDQEAPVNTSYYNTFNMSGVSSKTSNQYSLYGSYGLGNNYNKRAIYSKLNNSFFANDITSSSSVYLDRVYVDPVDFAVNNNILNIVGRTIVPSSVLYYDNFARSNLSFYETFSGQTRQVSHFPNKIAMFQGTSTGGDRQILNNDYYSTHNFDMLHMKNIYQVPALDAIYDNNDTYWS